VNTYRSEFFAACPTNGVRIKYSLQISTVKTIRVEDLIIAMEGIDQMYHEEIADEFCNRFGGMQTLTAEHHGVQIETLRGAVDV